MQTVAAQIETTSIILGTDANVIVQATSAQIVQPLAGQMPKLLELTSSSNHIEYYAGVKVTKNDCFIYSMPIKSIWLKEISDRFYELFYEL